MTYPTTYRKSGDVRPDVSATLIRPATGDAVDISGASAVTIYAKDPDGTLELDSVSATIADGAAGEVTYDVTSGDFAVVGEYDVEWEVDWDGAGDAERFPKKTYQNVKVQDELA